MIIAVDFDGTIVKHEYPAIGAPVPHALKVLKELIKREHQIILWTMRSGDKFQEAIKYLSNNNIEVWGENTNPEQRSWTLSPKAYAQIYIDDAALGCPLIYPNEGRPYVNWVEIIYMLNKKGLI